MNQSPSSLDIAFSEYVVLARNGDTDAFTYLIDNTCRMVNSVALAIVKNSDDANDVSQQVYIAVWQQLESLSNSHSFLPWIRQITRNLAFKFLRDLQGSKRIQGEAAEQLINTHSDASQDLQNIIERQQQGVILSEFIDELPAEDRDVVILYYREGESSGKVAELLGISSAAVRKKLSRARQKFKHKLLEKYGGMLLSTLPGVGFSSLVMSSLAPVSPVAAATVASGLSVSAKAKTTPWLLKILVLLGGAMLGALVAICAIFIGSTMQLKMIKDERVRAKIKSLRNSNTVFILFSGVALGLSYQLSTGWIAPVLVYTGFAIGLFIFTRLNVKLVTRDSYGNKVMPHVWACYIGLVLGLLGGYSGLILGLLNGGRLVL